MRRIKDYMQEQIEVQRKRNDAKIDDLTMAAEGFYHSTPNDEARGQAMFALDFFCTMNRKISTLRSLQQISLELVILEREIFLLTLH